MLKEDIYYSHFQVWIFKGKFYYNNKISFTCGLGAVFPPYFAFYRGFYTSNVEKKTQGMKNGQNAYSSGLAPFYSHFYVDLKKSFFNICV